MTTPEVGLRLFHPCRFSFLRRLVLPLVLCSLSPGIAGQETSSRPAAKPYALIYGTVWGPDNLPLYGVAVSIHKAGAKKPHWSVSSDHSGEFAQRVPAGRAEYLVTADLKGYKYKDGKHLRLPQEVTVHIENDERADVGLHLIE